MRKLIALLMALALILAVGTVPVSAHACDPGRLSNEQDSRTWIQRFKANINEVGAEIEIHTPYLEVGGFENQYVELVNGSSYMQLGVNYTRGKAPRLFWQGSGVNTGYFDLAGYSSTDVRIVTFETSAGRTYQFWNGNFIVANRTISSGRWTPNEIQFNLMSSNRGNQIVGHPEDRAYFLEGFYATPTTEYSVQPADIVWSNNNFPGFPHTSGHDVYGFWTRDNC